MAAFGRAGWEAAAATGLLKKSQISSLLSDWPNYIYRVLTTCVKGNREEGKKGWLSREPFFPVNWIESREQTALYSVNWVESRFFFFEFTVKLTKNLYRGHYVCLNNRDVHCDSRSKRLSEKLIVCSLHSEISNGSLKNESFVALYSEISSNGSLKNETFVRFTVKSIC